MGICVCISAYAANLNGIMQILWPLPPLACNYGQSLMHLCEVRYEKFLKRKHMRYIFGPAFGCCTLKFLVKICFSHFWRKSWKRKKLISTNIWVQTFKTNLLNFLAFSSFLTFLCKKSIFQPAFRVCSTQIYLYHLYNTRTAAHSLRSQNPTVQ